MNTANTAPTARFHPWGERQAREADSLVYFVRERGYRTLVVSGDHKDVRFGLIAGNDIVCLRSLLATVSPDFVKVIKAEGYTLTAPHFDNYGEFLGLLADAVQYIRDSEGLPQLNWASL